MSIMMSRQDLTLSVKFY